jgi:hypothetical protein
VRAELQICRGCYLGSERFLHVPSHRHSDRHIARRSARGGATFAAVYDQLRQFAARRLVAST